METIEWMDLESWVLECHTVELLCLDLFFHGTVMNNKFALVFSPILKLTPKP